MRIDLVRAADLRRGSVIVTPLPGGAATDLVCSVFHTEMSVVAFLAPIGGDGSRVSVRMESGSRVLTTISPEQP